MLFIQEVNQIIQANHWTILCFLEKIIAAKRMEGYKCFFCHLIILRFFDPWEPPFYLALIYIILVTACNLVLHICNFNYNIVLLSKRSMMKHDRNQRFL